MIKLAFCLIRKAGTTREEFQDYWRGTHAPLVRDAAEALGIRRYVQLHTTTYGIEGSVRAARAGMMTREYDGIAELWWDDIDSLVNAVDEEAAQRHGAILAADEAKFIDFEKSCIFFGEEFEVIP